MNKDTKQLTTGKRWLRWVGYVLQGAFAGGVVAYFAGFFNGLGTTAQEMENLLTFCTRAVVVLSFITSALYMSEAKGYHKLYTETDEDEEDLVDTYYAKMFRNLEFATIWFNVGLTLVIFNLVVVQRLMISSESAEMFLPFFEYGGLVVLVILQVILMKLTQKIRNYKLSAFPMIKEIKAYVDSYDEGERQANFERSFVTVFNLNQYILPALYLIVYFIATISQTQQLLAYVVIAVIHIYINLAQFSMIKNYFK